MSVIEADDFGLSRPTGVAYDPRRQVFHVATSNGTGTEIVRLSRFGDPLEAVFVREVTDAAGLTFDASRDRVVLVGKENAVELDGRHLRLDSDRTPAQSLGDVASISADGETGALYFLDEGSAAVSILRPGQVDSEEMFRGTDGQGVIAFNENDDLIYVLDSADKRLDAFQADGEIVTSFDTSSIALMAPEAMTFAPSTDTTDDPEILNLFVADSGDDTSEGGVIEVSLEQTAVVAAATIESATHIQTIDTSTWSPPSTDPSGIVWNPSRDEMIVVDSEIEEISLFQNVNMWHIDRSGEVLRRGATWGPNSAGSYSDEPTGLGYDNATDTLFISDDTGTRSVYVVEPGSDGELGTSDDAVTPINAGALGASDTEDPEFDPVTGHLFFLSGTDREVFRIDPVDGIFGNGNDLASSFDISHLGPTDFEGLTSSPSRQTLFIGSRNTDQIFEVNHDGQLVRTIDVDISANRFISGLAMAPSSVDPSVMSLWIVDRGIDENNDGQIFEIGVSDLDDPVGNLPPVVQAGPDQNVVFPNQATLAGSVSDDGLPEEGEIVIGWSKLSGPGTVAFSDASSASTTAGFSEPGVYHLQLAANDGELSASDDVIVTVEAPPNSSPSIEPIDDLTVEEGQTLVVPVSASDQDGDDLTVTSDGLPAFGSFDETTLELTFSPAVGDAGTYGPVTVTVSDGDPGGAQAPVFRSAASNADTSASGSTLTIARPDGVEEGDLLLAEIRYRGDVANLTPPSGWIEFGLIPDDSNGHHGILYKVAGPSEPTSYTFDQNADEGRIAGGIGAYVGVDQRDPIDTWAASQAETATLTAPDVDASVANTRVLRLWGWRGSSADESGVGFNVPPTGISQRWSEQLGHANNDRNRVLAGDAVQETAGAVGTATASGSQDSGERNRSSFTVVLAPAGEGLNDSTSFNVTVVAAASNAVPVAADDAASTSAGSAVTVDVLSNDSDDDGDDLSVVDVSESASGTAVVNPDETVTYTPDAGFSGTDTFTYRASDGIDASEPATVTVTVSNATPMAFDDSASTSVGMEVDIDVLANDSDEDGHLLSVVDLGQPSNGTAAVNPDEAVTYTPDAGFSGTDSFTYRASDGVAQSNVATVTVTVSAVNSVPVAVDDAASTAAGSAVTVDVLGNDTDADGDELSVVDLTEPQSGSVVVDPEGTVTYTPDVGFEGTDSFTYRASDGVDVSDPATVTVTVSAVNSAPVALDDSASTTVGVPVEIDVLSNDTDVDDDVLSVVDLTDPADGSVGLDSAGLVTYTPDAGFEGTDSFAYRASDGIDASEPATVTVTVSAVNSVPVAVDDSTSTSAGSAVTVDVLGNDSDADGDELSVVDLTDPADGSVDLGSAGLVTYTPDAGFSGTDTFTYRASDGMDASEPATVTVTVSAVNSAPVALDDSASTTVGVPVEMDVLSNDTDVDDDALSVVDLTDPADGSVGLDSAGLVTYTPDAGFEGTDSFTYRASDGVAQSNFATVTITVAAEELEQFALTSDTTMGTSSGSLSDTEASDDSYQQLSEEHTGGRPASRLSRLDHQWTFEVERGDAVSFVLEARRTSNADSDDFEFSSSVDGGSTFETLAVVDSSSDSVYRADLPATISGTVIVRVVDTDRTPGNGSTDSLFVDYMAIKTVNPQPPLPSVAVEATVGNASEDGDQGEFRFSRDDADGDLTVEYTVSGTASPGADYEALSGSVTLVDGHSSATVPVIPVNDDEEEGNESVTVAIAPTAGYQVGSPSMATVSIADNDRVVDDAYATDESTALGTIVNGDLSSTTSANDLYEEIREEPNAGGQRSRLEHVWTFSVPAGNAVTFFLQAHHTGTEDFMFAYSADGSSWSDMIQVTKSADDDGFQQFSLPTGVSGTVYVRVTDQDRSKREPVLDSIYVDQMFFRSEP